jgi:hypothetical protein
MNSGDLIFCHSKGLIGSGIRWAQRRLRNVGEEHKWNHVAVLHEQLPDGDWTVIQADAHGVRSDDRLSTIAPGGVYEIRPLPDSVNRKLFMEFLLIQTGAKYGYLSILSVALDLFLPESICLRKNGTWICSGLVAGALWFGGFPKMLDVTDLYTVVPAEIASWV